MSFDIIRDMYDRGFNTRILEALVKANNPSKDNLFITRRDQVSFLQETLLSAKKLLIRSQSDLDLHYNPVNAPKALLFAPHPTGGTYVLPSNTLHVNVHLTSDGGTGLVKIKGNNAGNPVTYDGVGEVSPLLINNVSVQGELDVQGGLINLESAEVTTLRASGGICRTEFVTIDQFHITSGFLGLTGPSIIENRGSTVTGDGSLLCSTVVFNNTSEDGPTVLVDTTSAAILSNIMMFGELDTAGIQIDAGVMTVDTLLYVGSPVAFPIVQANLPGQAFIGNVLDLLSLPPTGDGIQPYLSSALVSFNNSNLSLPNNPTTVQEAFDDLIEKFSSGEQTITSGGQVVIAHGLSSSPTIVNYKLICKSAELGYSVDDTVDVTPILSGITLGASRGVSSVVDESNITIRFGSSASSIELLNKSNGNLQPITNANWRLIVEAIRVG